MVMKLGEIADKVEGTDAGKNLQKAFSQVRSLTGEDVRGHQVRSVQEMGDAAGRCFIAGGRKDQIDLREDRVAEVMRDPEEIREFVHLEVHEILHKQGNHSEGLTDLDAARRTGTTTVDAYTEEVANARRLHQVIGNNVFELARERNAKQAVAIAYMEAKVRSGVDAIVALEEGAELWDLAA